MNQTDQPNNNNAGKMSRRRFLAAGTLGLGGLVAGDALLREPHAFKIEEIALPVAKIPPGRELRLVHISDLHIRAFHDYYQRVADAVNALAPEIILITGDFLEKDRNLADVRRFLELLQASKGIYAVQGNWEYWARLEGENMRRHLARAGVTLLIDQRHDLDVRKVPISVLGLDYPSPVDRLEKLQQQADPSRVNLLLSHVPAFQHEELDGRIDLILCGHTHGGQVRIPFVTPYYLPRFSGAFVSGMYRVGPTATPLYVTRGIGTSLFPVRFLCRPEITLLRLHAT
ncbi:metallophosphoesterase [Trichloromonas sp.]|uniref:metallophosphoesterase n=1 Tax=Trichloromonas sp. TaxID=3069249 RepID=UPI003D81A138